MDAAPTLLTKPFKRTVACAVASGTPVRDLQEELLLAREALRVQSTHDGLTGLSPRIV